MAAVKQAKRPAGKPVAVNLSEHVLVIGVNGKRRWVWVDGDGADHPTRVKGL